jgi:serine/threonine protein phosphatase PrpC
MACVLTLAVLENGTAVVGHVGDSRLYQVRRGEIRKVTHDHSPVGEREDSRELSEADAMRHPRRNEVFRDVGSEEHTPDDADFIEIAGVPFDAESALLLCSDGLSDQVPSAEIRASVERHAGNPQAAVNELIAAANRAGGKDNVTVLVVEGEQFTQPAVPPPPTQPTSWISHALLFAAGFGRLPPGMADAVWCPRLS